MGRKGGREGRREGRTDLLSHLGEEEGSTWVLLRGLEDVRVAAGSRHGEHPQGDHGGKIEGTDAYKRGGEKGSRAGGREEGREDGKEGGREGGRAGGHVKKGSEHHMLSSLPPSFPTRRHVPAQTPSGCLYEYVSTPAMDQMDEEIKWMV